jgi:hypothetical protein
MTHIMKFSLRLLSLVLTLFIYSCNSSLVLQKQGRFSKELNTCYFNDSLQFSYSFPGDYKQFAKQKDALREIKKINIHIKRKSYITGFTTSIPPYFEHYLLYLADSVSLHENFCQSNKFIAFKANNIKSYTIDTVNKLAYKVCKLENNKGYILIIAHAHPNEYFQSFINEYTKIFESVKCNSEYLNNYKLDLFKIANSAFYNIDSTPNYLKPLIALDGKLKSPDIDENQLIQVSATYHSFIDNSSDLAGLVRQFRESTYYHLKDSDSVRYSFINEDAVNYLIKECSKSKIVMFNEAHFEPKHSTLLTFLLKDLFNSGFRYLALESVWEDDTLLNQRKFAVINTGFYTREPEMSNLIREAIKMGYRIVNYDDFSGEREKNQAKKIYEKTLEKDSIAKVIVLSGFGHIHEKVSKNEKNMMAAEFKRISGIDPLTIDQIEFDNRINGNWLSIVDTNRLSDTKRITTDMYITNNFFLMPDKFQIKYTLTLPIELRKILLNAKNDSKYMISIYLKKEIEKSPFCVPIKNIYISGNNFSNNILLPRNEYEFYVKDINGDIVTKGNLVQN